MDIQSATAIQDSTSSGFPLVSIITVVYNGEQTLEKTIQSVATQTYPNVEYLIIDGQSTDGTLSIIKKYEEVISYWESEADKGIYDAMNKGISKSSGEIIHLLNADDTYVNEHVISQAVQEMKDSNYLSTKVNYLLPERNVILKMEGTNLATIPHPGFFVRRAVYHQRLFDLSYKYASDLDFIVKIKDSKEVKKGDIISVNMMFGGLGTSKECFQEATKIYLENGYYMVYLINRLKRLKNSIVGFLSRK